MLLCLLTSPPGAGDARRAPGNASSCDEWNLESFLASLVGKPGSVGFLRVLSVWGGSKERGVRAGQFRCWILLRANVVNKNVFGWTPRPRAEFPRRAVETTWRPRVRLGHGGVAADGRMSPLPRREMGEHSLPRKSGSPTKPFEGFFSPLNMIRWKRLTRISRLVCSDHCSYRRLSLHSVSHYKQATSCLNLFHHLTIPCKRIAALLFSHAPKNCTSPESKKVDKKKAQGTETACWLCLRIRLHLLLDPQTSFRCCGTPAAALGAHWPLAEPREPRGGSRGAGAKAETRRRDRKGRKEE